MRPRLVCDGAAIPAAERELHRERTRRLISELLDGVEELPDGFGFRLPPEEYESVVRFVAAERLCCPFLRFELVVSPERGPLRLSITGPEGAKGFLRAELLPPRGGAARGR